MSTTDMLKKAVAPAPVKQVASKKPTGLIGTLMDPKVQDQIKLALPKVLTAERLSRIIITEFRKNPSLSQCTTESFMSSVMQSAQLGLEPGSALGLAYLVPFNKSVKNSTGQWVKVKECQLIIGYRGMISLARRSGEILSINAYCVYEKDEFSYQLGLHPDIKHVPTMEADPGPVVYVYAIAQLRGGGVQFEAMSRAAVEAVRNDSEGWKSAVKYKKTETSPWHSNFDEMAKKTVIRKMFKYLPVSTEAHYAAYFEESQERGEHVTPMDVWDGVYAEKGVEAPVEFEQFEAIENNPSEPAVEQQLDQPQAELIQENVQRNPDGSVVWDSV